MSLYGSGLMHLFQEKDLGFFCKDCSNGSNALFSCDNRTTRAQPCYHLEGSPRPSMSSVPFLSLDKLVNTLEVCVGLTTDRYIIQNLKKTVSPFPSPPSTLAVHGGRTIGDGVQAKCMNPIHFSLGSGKINLPA